MLSRHFLRAKVLQAFYASQFGGKDSYTIEKNFKYEIANLNHLGVLQASTLVQFRHVAEGVINDREMLLSMGRTGGEGAISHRLLENKFLRVMEDNFGLRRLMEEYHVKWSDNEDIFRKLFASFRTTEVYMAYVSQETTTMSEDRDFVVQLFKYLMNDDPLREVIFDRSLLWEDDYDQIAQYLLMQLKAFDLNTFDESTPWPMIEGNSEKEQDDMNFAIQLLRDTLRGREETEELFKSHLEHWDFERVAHMDVMLVDMAVAELTGCPSIPERVTVDEYIELSKEFSTDKSKLFINGILDKLVTELRAAGRIQKSGRGLLDVSMIDKDNDE